MNSLIARVPPSSDLKSWAQVFVEYQYKPVADLFPDRGEKLRILDLGANVGYASAYFQEEFPRAEIVAVELDRENFKILNLNFHGRTILGGVWSHDCSLSIGRDFGDKREWSYYAIEDESGDVPGHSIHELVGEGVDILKMDIEGGEVELFKDDSWLKMVRVLAIEIHDEFNIRPTILRSLMNYGFTFTNCGELTVATIG